MIAQATYHPYNNENANSLCAYCRDESSTERLLAHTGEGSKHPLHETCIKDIVKYDLSQRLSPKCPTCRVPIDTNSLFSFREKVVATMNPEARQLVRLAIKTVLIHTTAEVLLTIGGGGPWVGAAVRIGTLLAGFEKMPRMLRGEEITAIETTNQLLYEGRSSTIGGGTGQLLGTLVGIAMAADGKCNLATRIAGAAGGAILGRFIGEGIGKGLQDMKDSIVALTRVARDYFN